MTAWRETLGLKKHVASIAAACLCAFAPARAQEAPRTLKLAFILPADSQLGAGATTFAAEISRRTGGRYRIEPYPNAMLGGEVAVLAAMTANAVDLAFVTNAPLASVVPAVGALNIPFLFHDVAEARRLLDGPIGAEYLARFDATGIHALAWGENGMRQLTNSKRVVRSPADLAGLRLRLPQSDVMKTGFEALGVDVKQIAFPQVYAALRTGTVDGQENPIATILSSRFYEVQRHLTLTSHVYDPAAVLMSEDAWNDLAAPDREAFTASARLAAQASRDYAEHANTAGLATIRAAGVDVVDVVDRSAFASVAAAAEPLYEKRFGREAIERIRAFGAPTPATSGGPGITR